MVAKITTLICALFVILLFKFRNLRRVLQTWRFVLKGRVIMLDQVRREPHKAFSLPVPGNHLHIMSSKEHWDDLNNAQTSQLSPNAASREMFQAKYTFGFDWSAPREHVSLATVRSIRNMTQRLPSFQEKFVAILDREFEKAFAMSQQGEGWTRVQLWPTIQRALARVNTLFLLGEDVANNEEFLTRSVNFLNQSSLILESVRLVPSFLAPLVAWMIKGNGHEQKYMFKILREKITERESYNKLTPESSRKKPDTFLEGVIDYCQDDRSTQQNVESISTVWVISALAIPVVTCQLLQDLYTQPGHFQTLREECQSVLLHDPEHSHDISEKMEHLPFLEAFAMESWRTKCFQSNTAHRVAVKPFQFSDGHKIPIGEAVEFNQHAHMTDESLYPDHKKFDPSRFLNKKKSLVDTGFEWPFWGVPRHICPGRWHVANTEKLVAVYMMQNFEAKFESMENLNFQWRDALVPNPKTILLMKRRAKVN